jgi:hypothetical protein
MGTSMSSRGLVTLNPMPETESPTSDTRSLNRIRYVIEEGTVTCAMCVGTINKDMKGYFDQTAVGYSTGHFHELCWIIRDMRKNDKELTDKEVSEAIRTALGF